jgi:hypothetical protein
MALPRTVINASTNAQLKALRIVFPSVQKKDQKPRSKSGPAPPRRPPFKWPQSKRPRAALPTLEFAPPFGMDDIFISSYLVHLLNFPSPGLAEMLLM